MRPNRLLFAAFAAAPLMLVGCSHAPRSGPPMEDAALDGAAGEGGGGAQGSAASESRHVLGCAGQADGECVPPGEGCACSDCLGTALCNQDQCVDDGACTVADSCICPDCHVDEFCVDSVNCRIDGVCDAFYEGCRCADCADKPQCSPDAGPPHRSAR